ncbi:CRISPR-associated endoribonuclease Cas6 [Listeria booriae]|uniref:CRISPR-associated endoribonuclease Cas6 n=1 Tax=Listeria booriae TaxID=1552123 RepID=UPI00162A3356|nr:CRISPR-associated endoribonuclease Cas6 [Listeria booriae]MBC1231263.1 CRISPR-associated endoribonuclease Cas6 [Listeria booriae]MBC2391131.1 CRISPR-associated endoribonuclease Cas6 [Listeria booriae]
MRLKIICSLDNEQVPLDYRSKILMIIKTGLAKEHPSVFSNLYDSNKQKEFTFSVYFRDAKFDKDEITVAGKEVVINFSTGNVELAIPFYNAFITQRWETIKVSEKCNLQIQRVEMIKTRELTGDSICFKTLSPIVCRDHNQETYKDWFYDYSDEEFENILKRNLQSKLEKKYGSFVAEDIKKVSITPINMKKTVVLHYDLYMACSIGLLKIEAPQYMLEYMASSGLGSITGMGFGMLEQV